MLKISRTPLENLLGSDCKPVILDAFVLGYLMDSPPGNPPPWYETFVDASNSGYNFIFSGLAFMEAINMWKSDNSPVDRQKFLHGIELASAFIEPKLPIIPEGSLTFFLAGLRAQENFTSEAISKRSSDIWETARRRPGALFYSDTLSMLQAYRAGHIEIVNAIRKFQDDLEKQIQDELVPRPGSDEWIALRQDEQAALKLAKVREILERKLGRTTEKVEQWTKLSGDEQRKKVRDDTEALLQSRGFSSEDTERMLPYLEMLMHFLEATTRRRDAYDPNAKRNRNNGIDHGMWLNLMLPAYLITECKWVNLARERGAASWKNWVLREDDFASQYRSNTLKPLHC